jgi:hypothetical protein
VIAGTTNLSPFWKRNWSPGRIFSFPVVAAGLLITTVFARGRGSLADPDIWFHLLNADYLFTNHRVLRTEVFSFTTAGLPWMNPEWIAEIPYYLLWRSFGLVGIEVLFLILLELVFLGLLYLCWRESGNIKASVLACYCAVFLGTVSFGPRTILFGYLYMIVLLVVLQRLRLKGSAPLWLLPPLFCLWVNTHGSWSIGLTVFGLVIASGFFSGKVGKIEAVRWSPKQLRQLLLSMGASVGAVFINPYGYHLVFWPVDVAFRQKLAIAHIVEWTSVDFHTPRGKVVLILLFGLILGALLSPCQWKLHEVTLALFGLYTGLTYVRFLILAGILIAPLLARLFNFVPPYRREIDKPILNGLLMAGMIVFIVHGFPTKSQLEQSVDKDYPAEILPFLKANPPTGHVLNTWLWGSYLCWHDRGFKDFIDGREDVFLYAGVFKDYLDFVGVRDAKAVLDKYKIKYVLIERSQPVCALLDGDPNWKVIFKGKVSVMYERIPTKQAVDGAELAPKSSPQAHFRAWEVGADAHDGSPPVPRDLESEETGCPIRLFGQVGREFLWAS